MKRAIQFLSRSRELSKRGVIWGSGPPKGTSTNTRWRPTGCSPFQNGVPVLPVEVSLLSTSNSRAFDLQKSFFHASIRCASSPFDPKAGATASSNASPKTHTPSAAKKKLRKFVPRKAAVELTDKSRGFFRRLLENPPRPEIVGVLLNYDQSSSGEPRMVFSFQFVTQDDVGDAEGVSLEVDADGKPKPPAESWDDGLPKLYVHPNAFLKVLGATVDVDTDKAQPILYDREGNKMDPND